MDELAAEIDLRQRAPDEISVKRVPELMPPEVAAKAGATPDPDTPLGMVVVGLPYSFKGQTTMGEISGGSPYGATTIVGEGERQPSTNELDGARSQGRHVAELAAARVRGREAVAVPA